MTNDERKGIEFLSVVIVWVSYLTALLLGAISSEDGKPIYDETSDEALNYVISKFIAMGFSLFEILTVGLLTLLVVYSSIVALRNKTISFTVILLPIVFFIHIKFTYLIGMVLGLDGLFVMIVWLMILGLIERMKK
jgi:hypothetical protein